MSVASTQQVFGQPRPLVRYIVYWRGIEPNGMPCRDRFRKIFGREHKAEQFMVNLMHSAETGTVVCGSVELVQETVDGTCPNRARTAARKDARDASEATDG